MFENDNPNEEYGAVYDGFDPDSDMDNEIETEPDFDFDEAESGANTTPPSNTGASLLNNLSQQHKTIIMAVVIGLVLLILALVIIRIANSDSVDTNTIGSLTNVPAQQEQTKTEPEQTEKEAADTSEPAQKKTKTKKANSVSDTYNTGSWTQVEDTMALKQSKTGSFTITNLRHYGMRIGETLQIKTVATGLLNGSSGEYGEGFESEIPSNMAKGLAVGDTLSVRYSMGVMGDTVVIGGIEPIYKE